MRNKNFWDLSGDGKFDFTDIAMGALYFICLTVGGFLMLSTFGRSLHLLTSPAFMPKSTELGWIQNLWPYVTAISSEAGLVIAWISCELGFRKGNLLLAAFGIIGGLLFGTIIATIGLYDTALIGGSDITEATTWGHFVASILPMFAIFYAAVCTMLLSAMSRMKEIVNEIPASKVTITQVPQRQPDPVERRLPQPIEHPLPVEQIRREYGQPVVDPRQKKDHLQAQAIAQRNLDRMKQASNPDRKNTIYD